MNQIRKSLLLKLVPTPRPARLKCVYACDLNELRTMWTHAHKVSYEVSLICFASPISLWLCVTWSKPPGGRCRNLGPQYLLCCIFGYIICTNTNQVWVKKRYVHDRIRVIADHEIFKIWSWVIIDYSLAKWLWVIVDHEKSDRPWLWFMYAAIHACMGACMAVWMEAYMNISVFLPKLHF